MNTIEKIRSEIQKVLDVEPDTESAKAQALALFWVLEFLDKYAEQEPCEDCDYSEIMDWEQDAKTGKAKPIYWCERHKEPFDDAVSRQAVYEILDGNWNTDFLRAEVEKLPSVRPQEQTGKWEFVCQHWRKCSECGFSHKFAEDWNFCPNCGCAMKGE